MDVDSEQLVECPWGVFDAFTLVLNRFVPPWVTTCSGVGVEMILEVLVETHTV